MQWTFRAPGTCMPNSVSDEQAKAVPRDARTSSGAVRPGGQAAARSGWRWA